MTPTQNPAPKDSACGPLEASVSARCAADLPALPNDPIINDAMRALIRGCQGLAYPGPEIEAQILTVKLLRDRPDLAKALSIGA